MALKVLRPVRSSHTEALRREVHALARLDHRGVVSVLDEGVADGLSWYAMPLLEGRSLAEELAAEMPFQRALRCIRDLCATLCYVHGEGVVHRDIKPSNVIIRDDLSTVLIDFGLAARFVARGAREELDVGGEFAGTVAYAAPEQLMGQFLDARTDLYALGCVLYQLAAGAPPFEGTPHQIAAAHLMRAPRPLAERVPQVDPRLDRLTSSLLKKRPGDRPGYAQDVVASLDELITIRRGSELIDPVGRLYFYRPNLSGRNEALELLRARLAQADDGRGACVVIRGESGIGKTRLAMELTRFVSRDALLVTGECGGSEGAHTAPLHAWRPLLRSIAQAASESPRLSRAIGDCAAVLHEVEPAFSPWVRDPAPRLLGVAARERLVEAFATTVESFAEHRFVAVLLDDLQWADELTLACLARLERNGISDRRLLIVGTYRSEEELPMLRDLAGQDRVEDVRLDPMTPEAIGAMVGDMLALPEPPEHLVAFIASQSEGNPFFVAEYLHEAAEAGLLRRASGQEWSVAVGADSGGERYERLSTPLTIRTLVERRLSRLTADAQRMMQAGAVIGRVFEPRIAGAAAGLEDARHAEAMGELMRRRVLEEDPGGAVRYVHDKLREAAYRSIGAARARALHGSVATQLELEHTNAMGFEDHYATLAFHYGKAVRLPEARRFHGLAGEHALKRGAFAEAAHHLQSAIRLAEELGDVDPVACGRWRRMNGSALFALGDLRGSVDETETALRTLGLRVPSSAWGWAGRALAETTRGVARPFLGRYAFGAARGDVLTESSIAATQLAASFYYDAQLLPSAAAVLIGVHCADQAKSPGRIADAYSRLAYIAGAAGLRRLAERWFERSRHAGEADEPGSLALSLYMDAMYRLGIGEWDRAIERGAWSAELTRRGGDLQEAEVAETIASHALFYSGRVDEARREYESILASARRRGNRQHMGWGLFLSGRSHLALGNVDEAVERLEAGYSHIEPLPDLVSVSMCEGLLATACLQAGRVERAAEVAHRFLKRLRDGKRPAVGQCLDAYAGLAETLAELHRRQPSRTGRADAARAAWELRAFALFFPIARPASLRVRARARAAAGRRGDARELAAASVSAASRLGMTHEAVRGRALMNEVGE